MEAKEVSKWYSEHVIPDQIGNATNFLFANTTQSTAHDTLAAVCKLQQKEMSSYNALGLSKIVRTMKQHAMGKVAATVWTTSSSLVNTQPHEFLYKHVRAVSLNKN